MNVDRNKDVFLVRGNRHLNGVETVVEVTAVQVPGADAFQVARKLLTRILVTLRVPGKPARSAQLHHVTELGSLGRLETREMNFLNGRSGAFINVDRHTDAVAFERRDVRRHFNAIVTFGEVLTAQFLCRLVKGRRVEDTAFSKTRRAERLLNFLLIKRLDAVRLNRRNGRAFDQMHNDDIAILSEIHIAEESRLIKRTDGERAFLRRVFITHAEGQMRKHRARLGSRNTLDANVLDRELLSRRRERQCRKDSRYCGFKGKSLQCHWSLSAQNFFPPARSADRRLNFEALEAKAKVSLF